MLRRRTNYARSVPLDFDIQDAGQKTDGKDCMVVKAPQGASKLYLVAGWRGSVSMAADLGKSLEDLSAHQSAPQSFIAE